MAKREKKEKKVKEKQQKPAKPPKIKHNNAKDGFRAAVIIILLFFFAIGVYFVLNYEDSGKIIKEMGSYKETLDIETQEQSSAEAFAENFITEYYTYDPNDTTYSNKVSKYLADGLSLQTPSTNTCKTITASTSDYTRNENEIDVDVRASIEYTVKLSEIEQDTKKGETTKQVLETQIIRVPLEIDEEGNLAVVSIPTYVGDNNKAGNLKAIQALSGSSSDLERSEIENLTENFLNAYLGNDPDKLKYFTTESFDESVVGGLYTLSHIDNCVSVASGNGKDYYADVTYTIDNNGIQQQQRLFLTIQRTDRYYVDKITTR